MFDFLLNHSGLHFPYSAGINMPLIYVLAITAFLLATTAHEFGHAWMADRLGDPTPRAQGRVRLLPWAHLDPLGTLLMIATSLIGFPIGWGKPVRTNPEAYTKCSPKVGIGLVAAAGPLANLLFAVLLAVPARMVLHGWFGGGDFALWSLLCLALLMLVNISLFCFNLVPISPLDAATVVGSLLPEPWSKSFLTIMKQFGPYLLIILMYTGALYKFLGPLVARLFSFLIGIPL